MAERPLILLTNDDGIESHALWAAVEAVLPLGDALVVAPNRQWSGAGRSMPYDVSGCITPAPREVAGRHVPAFAVDASPALTVIHAVLQLAPRCPNLVVSGINFGANLGIEVTISGTVGAALEAAAFGIPALAVSLEMDAADHLSGPERGDYRAAQVFTQRFARLLLESPPVADADLLNVNIPADATPASGWRRTRLSRRRYFLPLAPEGTGRPGYRQIEDVEEAEEDTDIRAVKVDGVVSVTPLSLDLTARGEMERAVPELPQAIETPRTGPATDVPPPLTDDSPPAEEGFRLWR